MSVSKEREAGAHPQWRRASSEARRLDGGLGEVKLPPVRETKSKALPAALTRARRENCSDEERE